MLVPTFKMETAETIRNSVTKGEWLVSIDLKDAYFHIPIHPDSQHLLHFQVDKRTYQFKALLFGFATAPLEFTRIVTEASSFFSLADFEFTNTWIAQRKHQTQLSAPDKRTPPNDSRNRLHDKSLKSELEPTQKIDFLGYHFDLVQEKVSPTEKKPKILQKSIQGHVSPSLAHLGPLESRNILIRAKNIQGFLNVIADSLSSKDKIIQTEWSLHPRIFSLISKVCYQPMVNMFATKMNHKLPLYVSPVPDANALNIDAFNISWEGLDDYVYCPVALFPKVIQKMNTYRCKMIVVAPGCLMIHWFWDLVNLSTKPTLQLPCWPHLLKQPFSHNYHQNLLYLNLHVWHLDTTQNHLNHSLSRWQRELRHLKDPHLENCHYCWVQDRYS